MHFGFSQYLSDQQIISLLVTLINHHFNPQSNILLQHFSSYDCFNPLVIIPKKKNPLVKITILFILNLYYRGDWFFWLLPFSFLFNNLIITTGERFEHQMFCSKVLLKSLSSYSSYLSCTQCHINKILSHQIKNNNYVKYIA